MFKRVAVLFVAVILIAGCVASAQVAAPTDYRVLIVSIDGMRPDVMLRADTPVMHDLMKHGAFTMWARTTEVAVTLPSHTSMITGVTPKRHGITWNGDVPADKLHYPAFPTVMELGKKAGYTTAMTAGKSKFVALNKPGTIDWVSIPGESKVSDEVVADHAVQFIHDHQPRIMFVHFPQCDSMGHQYGWGSHEQVRTVANADKQLGRVLKALDEAGVRSQTLIIVTADHGGQGKSHGRDDPRSRHIPWIATGPGVQADHDLTLDPDLIVNTEDTFATACWFMRIAYDKDIDGKPVTQILAQPAKP